jgi:hypothetical protein
MKRLLVVPLLSLATVGALTLPAHAKGPMESASGQVVITGPGLKGPIELSGTVEGFAEPGGDFMPSGSGTDSRSEMEFTAFLFESGVFSNYEGDHGGWFVLRPDDLRSIGPGYQLRLNLAGEGWSESIARQIYPFAPERPLIFTPAESINVPAPSRMQSLRGLWWSAPPALLTILHAHGLPRSAPPVGEPPAAPASPAVPHPQGWIVLWTAMALLGLLLAGVVAGRRRSARRIVA